MDSWAPPERKRFMIHTPPTEKAALERNKGQGAKSMVLGVFKGHYPEEISIGNRLVRLQAAG